MSEKEVPLFGIKRIKPFSFLLDESLAVIDKKVRIQFQHHTTFHGNENIVDLTLRVYYSYDTKIPPDSVLVDFHVQNLFEVKDLIKYRNEKLDFILPQNLMTSMLGIAISHLRALMAQNIAGTAYQDNIVPIVDPAQVAAAFYPNMFNSADSDKNSELTQLNFKNAIKDLNKAINNTTNSKKHNKKALKK